MNILIVDDEKYMTSILKTYFQKEGFNVFTANNGEEALDIFYNNKIDISILDWMMPRISGVDVCKEIKNISKCKVIILTARSENEDELKALNIGADDYIRKPFDPRVVILRAKKMMRVEKILNLDTLKIDFQSSKVFKNGEDLNLTKIEFQLIKCFCNYKGEILSRQRLIDLVWGLDYIGEERTVDTHINRLRDKIGRDLIKTHRGMGYSFEYEN